MTMAAIRSQRRFVASLAEIVIVLLCFCPSVVVSQRTILSMMKVTRDPAQQQSQHVEGEDSFFLAIVATTLFLVLGGFAVVMKSSSRKHQSDDGERSASTSSQSKQQPEQQQLPSVDVAFSGIALSLHKKKQPLPKTILDGSIRGRAQPGRLLGIMGPSGSGKTSVLHAVAGRTAYQSNLALTGRVHVNGRQQQQQLLPAAFVVQEAVFFPYMTVRETVAFRVELQLGSLLSAKQREETIDSVLAQMGLTHVADTIVGDAKVRGISGGERKRLSIAVELVASPSVVVLDEPTSGLDSTAAMQLVSALKALADTGKTVIAVLHQPSQHVFALLDDLLLVSEGRQMYFGPRSRVRSYMSEHGCSAPTEMGTAEHILDCISRSPIGNESEVEIEDRMSRLAQAASKATIDLGLKEDAADGLEPAAGGGVGSVRRAGIFVQFRLLLNRSLRELFRGKTAIILKCVQQVTTAVIYGGIYKLGLNQASIADRIGLLSLVAIGAMNSGLVQTIRSFPREKAIVSKELASRMYGTFPYFVAKAISEIPLIAFLNSLFGVGAYYLTGLNQGAGKIQNFLGILSLHGLVAQSAGLFIGSCSKNSDIALAMMPPLIILSIIFDGRNISEENIPVYLRWLPKLGLIRWGFQGLCINEFLGLKFDKSSSQRGQVALTGEEALEKFGLGGNLAVVVRSQALLVASFWFLSYVGLSFSRQKYLVMRPSKETST